MNKNLTEEEIEAQIDRLRGLLIIATADAPLGIALQCLGELSAALIAGGAPDKDKALRAAEEYCCGIIRTTSSFADIVADTPLEDDEEPAPKRTGTLN